MADELSFKSPLRATLFLGVAAVAGSTSLVALFHLISSYEQALEDQRQPEDTVMVMVAARDLYQGITITEEDLYAIEIPPRFLSEGVFLSPDHVVGRIPRERVLANEFVRSSRLANPESGIGMNAVIPRGMRALSVNISDGRALSGFLNPGNYVDLLVTMAPEDDSKDLETKTLMQAMFVLGVNSRMGAETRDEARKLRGQQHQTITLLVSSEQAEELAFAEHQGDLRLLLRNDNDVDANPVPGVDMDDLRGKLRPIEVISFERIAYRSEDPEGSEVIMIRGPERHTEEYDADGVRK